MTTNAAPEPVLSKDNAESTSLGAGVTEYAVGPAVPGSPVSLGLLEMAQAASVRLRDAEADQVLYVLSGSVRAVVDEESFELLPESALRLAAGEEMAMAAGDGGSTILRAYAGPSADVHAPLGEATRVAVANLRDARSATSNRKFQILFNPENGFPRGTLFLGVVPPGAAPWHFHQYEEVMWVHRGRTTFHLAGGSQEMDPGCVVRIRPRAPHVNENPDANDVYVLGLITPASSPSAAYLSENPAE